jgi:hypothetical protein
VDYHWAAAAAGHSAADIDSCRCRPECPGWRREEQRPIRELLWKAWRELDRAAERDPRQAGPGSAVQNWPQMAVRMMAAR